MKIPHLFEPSMHISQHLDNMWLARPLATNSRGRVDIRNKFKPYEEVFLRGINENPSSLLLFRRSCKRRDTFFAVGYF